MQLKLCCSRKNHIRLTWVMTMSDHPVVCLWFKIRRKHHSLSCCLSIIHLKKRKKASHVYKFFSCPHEMLNFNIFLNTLFAIKNITNQHEGTWECCMEEKSYRTLFWASKVCKRGLLLWILRWSIGNKWIEKSPQEDKWMLDYIAFYFIILKHHIYLYI